MQPVTVLASDMDGTFIPLEGNQQNRRDLETLAAEIERRGLELVYVTGRHFELVVEAIDAGDLPQPRWLICDVGTSIYRRTSSREYDNLVDYAKHLAEITAGWDVESLADRFRDIKSLRIQEPEKQGPFKLSYYCDAAELEQTSEHLTALLLQTGAPYRIISSVDPFTGDGLVDFLPQGVSKAHALSWWVDHLGWEKQAVVFAGDSGNDLAALVAGYRSIVVGNAAPEIAEQVRRAHQDAGWENRLCLAAGHATSGVLEGLRYFAGA